MDGATIPESESITRHAKATHNIPLEHESQPLHSHWRVDWTKLRCSILRLNCGAQPERLSDLNAPSKYCHGKIVGIQFIEVSSLTRGRPRAPEGRHDARRPRASVCKSYGVECQHRHRR
eukprot:262284-Pleurochrysis_carterae.AAC.9